MSYSLCFPSLGLCGGRGAKQILSHLWGWGAESSCLLPGLQNKGSWVMCCAFKHQTFLAIIPVFLEH
jgi:hypothetical protein